MLYFLSALIVFFVAAVTWHNHNRTVNFNARFAPIDDDEFVRRCGPGVRRDIALRVRRVVSEQLGIEYSRIYPEQSFVQDLDCE